MFPCASWPLGPRITETSVSKFSPINAACCLCTAVPLASSPQCQSDLGSAQAGTVLAAEKALILESSKKAADDYKRQMLSFWENVATLRRISEALHSTLDFFVLCNDR